MKSRKIRNALSLWPLGLSTLLSGCLFGENKTFFDYSKLNTELSSAVGPGGVHPTQTTPTPSATPIATATPIASATPNYGYCCDIAAWILVPASSTGCDAGQALVPVSSPSECVAPAPTPTIVPIPTASPSPSPIPTPVAVATPTPTPPHVCDPFDPIGGGGGGTVQNGIKAKMYYYTQQALKAHPYQGVLDFFRWGQSPNVDFFFSNFYTPTRAFDSGFLLNDGRLLSDGGGNPLFEYFALQFTGGIQLPPGKATKQMQFAVLADDGVRFSIVNQSGSSLVVDNDGDHPTRLGCATAPITVSADQRLKFELDYYQGPRYHIALILLWREWSSSAGFEPNDPWCGKSGNSLYFDSTKNPSKPQPAWNDLMNRWEVVPNDVFYVSGDNAETNPCH